jgi:hypothetical protein
MMDALISKESSEKLIDYSDLHGSSIFAMCILEKTKKSLDYLKTTVERYRKVFDHFFNGD